MAPPEGSIFDPASKWKEEKDRREKAAGIEAELETKLTKKSGGGGAGHKQNPLDQSDHIYMIKAFQDQLLNKSILIYLNR